MSRSKTWATFVVAAALALTVVTLGVALSPAGVAAQPTCTAGGVYSGDVTNAGANVVVRGTDGGERTFTAAPNATVIKDGRNVAFSDLKATDQVNVTTNADCSASRIEATSRPGERGFNPLWLLPLLLLPLLAIPFLRRRQTPVRVERETTVQPVRTVERTETVARPAMTEERVIRPTDGPDVTIERTDERTETPRTRR